MPAASPPVRLLGKHWLGERCSAKRKGVRLSRECPDSSLAVDSTLGDTGRVIASVKLTRLAMISIGEVQGVKKPLREGDHIDASGWRDNSKEEA
jgi:hypothetical protein